MDNVDRGLIGRWTNEKYVSFFAHDDGTKTSSAKNSKRSFAFASVQRHLAIGNGLTCCSFVFAATATAATFTCQPVVSAHNDPTRPDLASEALADLSRKSRRRLTSDRAGQKRLPKSCTGADAADGTPLPGLAGLPKGGRPVGGWAVGGRVGGWVGGWAGDYDGARP